MSGFEAAMTAWLGVLSAHGCEISHFMNLGASETKISEIEQSIGFSFTEDLKELYLWADGQKDYIGSSAKKIVHYADGGADVVYDIDPSPGKYFCPLFGHYSFDSLDVSLRSYLQWVDIVSTSSHDELIDNITIRSNHAVDKIYFKKGWFPISNNSAGDSFAVDFAPPEGGTYGQIIVVGPNEDERRVVARSITELLELASTCNLLKTEFMKNGRHSAPMFMDYDMECW